MKRRARLLWFALLCAPAVISAAELKQETIKAWNDYIRAMESRMKDQIRAGRFLWIDQAPGRVDPLRRGEVTVAPVGEHNPKTVAHGLIHDWVGAVFVPHARLADVFDVVRDYARYREFYGPAVIESKRVSQLGPHEYQFSMVLLNQSLFQKSALEGDYKSTYVRIDEKRWYSITYTTRVQQIDDYGQPGEHKLSEDQGSGYIWRLYSITRFEERDGGVYVELEAAALSREIPFSLRWVVDPIVRRVSKTSLTTSLKQTIANVGRPGVQVAQAANPMRISERRP